MSLWRQVTRGLRTFTNRNATERDICDETASYLEQTTAAFVASGMSFNEARRAAQLHCGSITSFREQVRSYGWENLAEAVIDSLRYAVRRLRHTPGFTAVSLLMLSLGIGASTAMFAVIDGVLLTPLPYPHSEQLVSLGHTAPGVNITDLPMSPSLYFTYSDENRVFQNLALWSTSTSSVTGIAEPEEVPVLMLTQRLLPTLGVKPALGRPFAASDDEAKSAPTVMLSDGYWRSHFGGNRSVLGRRIVIDGDATEIIGVLPPSFQFMDQAISLLMPFRLDRSRVVLLNFGYQGVARLKPGVTIQQANADIVRMIPMTPAKFPPNPGFGPNAFEASRIGPNLLLLKDDLIGDSGATLWVLMGTVAIVLLIACANVANLSLVRADGRQQELAVRSALGGGRGRILGELLLECLLLGLVGGAIGLAVAVAALRILKACELTSLPRLGSVSINPWVLAFALATSLASGLVFGLITAAKYARPQLLNALKSGGRSLSESKDRHRARSILVVVQGALALILLVSSGLMVRTFLALHHVDPGFSGAKQVQVLNISIPEAQAKEPERVIRTEQEILRRLSSMAGVSSVAITNTAPMDGGTNDAIYTEDQVYREGTLPAIRRYKYISPGYVATIGSRLIAGRDLTWNETYNQTPVGLVSENLALELWHDPRAAIGKRIRPTLKDDWREVVGVVADLHDTGVDQKAPAIAYWPLLDTNFQGRAVQVQRSVNFVIRTPRAGSTALLRDIQEAVWSVNSSLPVANVRTLASIYDRSTARTSFTLILLAIAGGMALLLGLVGIYGVISYSVLQRTREIGIRLALGAPPKEITQMFVRNGLLLCAVGAACGLSSAFVLTRLMSTLLFDVSPADPLTYVTALIALMATATFASYLPARNATKVDPSQALRAQ